MRTTSFTLAAGVLLMLVGTAPASANMYKWVDEKGVVHYGDTIPPEYVKGGTTELNRQGRAIKRTAPALTEAQIRAQEEEKTRRLEDEKTAREQKRKDDALLATYTSVKEIDQLRARSVTAVEAVVKGAQNRIAELKKRKTEIDAMEKSKQRISAEIRREQKSIEQELPVQQGLVEQKSKELVAINVKFDTERRRFEEIKLREGAAGKAK
ncbi:MAG: DUF4124 domain-containing protein [Betaproteobacteria bacterium]|nr:DUF4124 domain-containing protein [Betaproteobacteria bacterium]